MDFVCFCTHSAPFSIQMAVNLFKPIFPAHSFEKLKFFYRGDLTWKDTLKKELSPQCIPTHLDCGGTAIMTNIVNVKL